MVCDYYVESSLIIDYVSNNGSTGRIITNTTRARGYVKEEDDIYLKTLKRRLKKNTGIKILYDDNTWLKEKYQNRYEKKLQKRFPEIIEYKKIYKDYIAWST